MVLLNLLLIYYLLIIILLFTEYFKTIIKNYIITNLLIHNFLLHCLILLSDVAKQFSHIQNRCPAQLSNENYFYNTKIDTSILATTLPLFSNISTPHIRREDVLRR